MAEQGGRPAGGAPDGPIAHLLTPLKRGTKDYLLRAVVPSLVHGLTQLAIERPGDPHLWLAEYLLSKASGQYKIVAKCVLC